MATQKLTVTNVKNAKPTATGKRKEIGDTQISGLLLRITGKGHKSWAIRYRHLPTGKYRRYTIGAYPQVTLDAARKRAVALFGEIAKGRDPSQEKHEQRLAAKRRAEMPTFKEFVRDDFQKLYPQRQGKEMADRLIRAFPGFKTKLLDSITTWQILKWRAKRKKGLKPATVARELTLMKRCLTHAVTAGLLNENVATKIKPEEFDNARECYLTPAETKRLRKAIDARDDHMKPLIHLLLLTGLRRSEAFNLRWENIDFRRKRLHIKHTKSKYDRYIPLHRDAGSHLKAWGRKRRGLVFPGPSGNPMTNCDSAWNSIRKAAKLQHVTLHDLRHHFASSLVDKGVSLYQVSKLLGHRDPRMTQRYAHIADGTLQDAVALL